MSERDTARNSAPTLVRRLGLFGSIGMVIGITIGSGIFRTPASIAARVPDPLAVLGVWLLGGLIALCGAWSVASLAASTSQTGGWYVYLRDGWGRLPAFLFGWSELVLIRASATGAMATVAAEYLQRSLGYEPGGVTTNYLAAAAIVTAAAINIRGVQAGAVVTGISTVAKLAALAALALLAYGLGDRAGASISHLTARAGTVSLGNFGAALISVLWAYDGFADVSFAAGEVITPQRTLPRAIVIGTVAIVILYVTVNLAYLYVTPIQRLGTSPLIAADTMQALVGASGVTMISIVVAISTFGALNGTMLAAPRVFFAMADDGLFFKSVVVVHRRYHTPHVAIGLSAVLGVLFALTRTFEQLADTFVLSIWPFYGLAVAGLIRAHCRRGRLRRILTPGSLVAPAVFIAAVVFLVSSAFIDNPLWTMLTFGVVFAGIPVYKLMLTR